MHLALVTECLNQIRATEMSPLLQRLYNDSEGGSELCDTLMKYLYAGMAQGSMERGVDGVGSAGKRTSTPQPTGFSQVGGRSFGGAEGGGTAMSVFLSWHEKVSLRCM